MASVTTNMGLTKWDDTSDTFSHAQLADNWQLVSDHDHTPGKGVQISYGGLGAQSVGSTQLRNGSVLTNNILDLQVTSNKLASNISGAKLANDSIPYTRIAKDGSGHAGVFSADLTVTSGAAADTPLNGGAWAEAIDLSSWFDALTGRFTPLVKGVYQFLWSVKFVTTTDQARYAAHLYKNGAVVRTVGGLTNGTSVRNVTGSTLFVANGATDYFQVGYYSATSVSITATFEGLLVARQS